MNSYPSEFLSHLRPVMFVAGLDGAPDPPPSDAEMSEDDRVLGKSVQSDAFASLTKRLREALQEKSVNKGTIWIGDAGRAEPGFKIVMVDKNVRFPPQKATGADSHSPLSPLTKTSPLYPDGLVAPIWIRKHIELLPSVFVLFLRLYEHGVKAPPTPISPLHSTVVNEKEEERRKEEERKRDSELSAEIAIRKRACTERGIKLTVVLIASRRMLDDKDLDPRLTHIRRQSGLDSRAALFVLSPVNSAELQEFVKSLQGALHDSALEYYTSHSKRVRRKRNRQTGTAAAPSYGALTTPGAGIFTPRPAQPLRPQGWITRYEYKMGCFAEFRGEEEVARKHFQTAWEILVDMFGAIGILPPRTKRWAEAKVLADCISVKIIKLYLYRGEHSRAVAHFNAHLTRFAELSRIWGIGEETWEFWSSTARWYRILAELLELAMSNNMEIPRVLPTYPIVSQSLALPPVQQSLQQMNEPPKPGGINPSSLLQHPGYYYYAAALCTQQRLDRFLIADQEVTLTEPSLVPNNLANERKVDHKVIILELYRKAYELFKKHGYGQNQNRFTYHVASRIAQMYTASGQPETAVKFYERIAKIYKREHWDTLLRPVLSEWYTSCRQTGDIDTAAKLLVEMLCYGNSNGFKVGDLDEELSALLSTTIPTSSPIRINMAEQNNLFEPNVVFWKSVVGPSQPAPFQLQLRVPAAFPTLPWLSIEIEFSDGSSPLIIHHNPLDGHVLSTLQYIDVGHVSFDPTEEKGSRSADLRCSLGGKLILGGYLSCEVAKYIKVSNVIMKFSKDQWELELSIDATVSDEVKAPPSQWLCKLEPPKLMSLENTSNSVSVRPWPHRVQVEFSHDSPAYLDEDYPITITITNTDEHALNVTIDALLQPAENDTVNYISIDTERSTGLIKGVAYDILQPGETSHKNLFLHSVGSPGDRSIDISVQCEIPKSPEADVSSPISPTTSGVTESLHTLLIPTICPLESDSNITYNRRPSNGLLIASDLKGYEASHMEIYAAAILNSTLLNAGSWDIDVHNIKLIMADDCESIKQGDCSLDSQDFPLNLQTGDSYSVSCDFSILGHHSLDLQEPLPSPGYFEVEWSRSQTLSTSNQSHFITHIPLPTISVPHDDLEAILDLPAEGALHAPFTASLRVHNNHAWRTADIFLQLEPSDNFVVSGLRSGSLPILLPGTEESILFNLIPIACGTVRLPNFKLFDRRKEKQSQEIQADGSNDVLSLIPVFDRRIEQRDARGDAVSLMVLAVAEDGTRVIRTVDEGSMYLFVSPP